MRVTPRTEKQIEELGLFPKGVYPFEIIESAETTSKAGNDMIALKLRIYNHDGTRSRFLNDYLMDTEMGAGKLRHCAEVCGCIEKYEAGILEAADLWQKQGFVKIGIKTDKSGKYPDQNTVYDYLSEPSGEEPKPEGIPADDDIPF